MARIIDACASGSGALVEVFVLGTYNTIIQKKREREDNEEREKERRGERREKEGERK